MSIKPSAAAEIRTLIASLTGQDPSRREAAAARLAVIGRRAIDRLLVAYTDPTTSEAARIAILRVFESVADPRPLTTIRKDLSGSPALASAAAGALRSLLASPSADTASEALDALVSVILDRTAVRSTRLAAYDAVRDMPADVQWRLSEALSVDRDPVIRARGQTPGDDSLAVDVEWRDALVGQVSTDAGVLLRALRKNADVTFLGDLQKLVDITRDRERQFAETESAAQWRELRGELHEALARRGSTVAVYDLRETIATADQPLPATFIAALVAVGDQSCLPSIAEAYERSDDQDWRSHLVAAFRTIATREKVGPRHPVFKRIAGRWPEARQALSMTSRTTPRRPTRDRT